MTQYIYSPRNKNHQLSVGKIWSRAIHYPKAFWQRLKYDKPFRQKFTRFILYFAAFFLLAGSILLSIIALSLPNPAKLDSRIIPQSTKIYARDGTTLLYEIHGEAKRTLIELAEIPDYVKWAPTAIEDKNFYSNHCIQWGGLLRSLLRNIASGELTGKGGSPRTQPLV